MIQRTQAIVLHQIKYSETSIIVTLFTKEFGRQSYIINGIRSPKSKSKAGLFQPLFLLDIEANHKPGRELQRLNEFRIDVPYQSIPFHVVKNTIALFLSEVLYKVLQSEMNEESLFDFIHDALQYFDTLEAGAANFHLWFLINVAGYLGFQPERNYDLITTFFNLKSGRFESSKPPYPNMPDQDDSLLIAKLLELDIENLSEFHISGAKRSILLEHIIEYYSIHFEGFSKVNSLQVLNEIFH